MNRPARFCFAVVLAAGFLTGWIGTLSADDVLVVTRAVFAEKIQPWIQYRQSQGWTVHLLVVEPEQTAEGNLTPESIRNKIRSQAAVDPISAILLVGDGAMNADDRPSAVQTILPAARLQSEVIQDYGSEDHIASDSWYADWNDDGLPDAAVGRLPVRTASELDGVIQKIIRYETQTAPGLWQRNLNFIAGVGGFSPLLDTVINRSIRSLLDDLLPGSLNLMLTQADWHSPYCPDPKMFRYLTLDQINDGPLFWIYMGHGNCDGLDYLQTPAGNFRIMEIEDAQSADVRSTAPIMLFFACYTGSFDANRPSLAEQFFLQPNGPAAVLAASRTTMPYGMLALGTELIHEAFYGENQQLGMILLAAQRRAAFDAGMFDSADSEGSKGLEGSDADAGSVQKEKTDEHAEAEALRLAARRKLDKTAKMFDPAADDLEGERLDHIRLFNLFGDPLLAVQKPALIPLKLETPEGVNDSAGYYRTAGETVIVSGEGFSGAGPVRVELALPANRQKISAFRRTEFSLDDARRAACQRTYDEANNRVVAAADGVIQNGAFSVELPIPPDASGRYWIRAAAVGAETLETGSLMIRIRRPAEEETAGEEEAGDSPGGVSEE